MFFASLLVCAGPFLSNAAQDQAKPDPKRVEAAVDEITTALKEAKSSDERIAAIRKNQDVVDAKVVAAIERGFKDKDPGVQAAAVDALGRMPHPEALEALHKLYKSDKERLKDDEKLLPLVFKAIGRHGSERTHEPGGFWGPHGIWTDSEGSIYVAEVLEGRRLQKFARKK